MKTKSALSWFGSDAAVAPELGTLFDHCDHVTIGFVGGASLIPFLKARAIIANDLDRLAITFYRVLAGRTGSKDRLIELCERTLSHPAEVDTAEYVLRNTSTTDATTVAWAFWVVCWLKRKGSGGTSRQGRGLSYRWTARGGTNATRIRSAANGLHEWSKECERCEWSDMSFRELHPKIKDQQGCGLYDDPPWVEDGKRYLHPFTEQDHRDLATEHNRFQHTTVVVRYGDHPLIRELYPEDKWGWMVRESRTQANKQKREVWITNGR